MKLHVGNRFFSSTAFIDLLFNIIVGVAFLFMIAFLLINPVSKKNDVESKADYLIILTWDNTSHDDIDLWMRDPVGKIMSFKSKDVGFMHLDRDDLGTRNDKVTMPDGTIVYVILNREIAALRGTFKGWYVVNVHAYKKSKKYSEDGTIGDILTNARVELIQVNPYKLVTVQDLKIESQGQEFTAFAFRLDEDGKVQELSGDDKPFVSLLKYVSPEGSNDGDARRFLELYYDGEEQ